MRLPRFPGRRIATDRLMAEEWLYKGHPRDFSAFDTLAGLYFVRVDRDLYASRRLPLLKWMRFVLRSNWVKLRKHLFGYDYKAKRRLRYQVLRTKK